MLERLESIRQRYEELNQLLSNPEVIHNADLLRKYSKEQSDLEPKYHAYCEYKEVADQYEEARIMLEEESDPEMLDLVKTELEQLSDRKKALEEEIRLLLLPKDPNDDKNVIVEIRGLPAGRRRLCLRRICIGCIPDTESGWAGNRRSWIRTPQGWAVLKKWCFPFRVKVHTAD